jgi:hypothetical protein
MDRVARFSDIIAAVVIAVPLGFLLSTLVVIFHFFEHFRKQLRNSRQQVGSL